MENPLLKEVVIFDIADKGQAVGKSNDKIVFVEGAVPGDVCDVQVFKKHKYFDEGRLVHLVAPSPDRVDPICTHFGICGGCKWQHLDYTAQLRFKEKLVRDSIQRLAGMDPGIVQPIVGAPFTSSYRNKLEFTFTSRRYLLKEEMLDEGEKEMNGVGFHIPGMFSKVLNINQCHLQEKKSNDIRNFVREFTLCHGFTYFDLRKQTGLMRNLVIRNTTLNEWMVVVVFAQDDPQKRELLMEAVAEKFPELTSLQYIINTKRNDTIYDLEPVVIRGKPFITEQLDNLKFLIGPKSFFQTNSIQALTLYKLALDLASLTGHETVYDLYTGTGTIASFAAGKARKVIGIESVPEAIADARINAANNNISNIEFFAGDMKNMLTDDFFRSHGTPEVIITDPPRAGMHEAVVRKINESGTKRIVYVSCNPATQARDIKMLSENYEVAFCQPVDMFPHTSHVENVILLVKK